MSTATLKKLALALTLWLALHMAPLRAQLVGPYGTSPITFEVDANGLLSATGTFGTGSLSLSGAGTRMFWYPGKAAFRAGGISSTYYPYATDYWNDANMGYYSAAFGLNAKASGNYSMASGLNTTASGNYSIAFGVYSTAAGWASMAAGVGTTTSGNAAVALGEYASASGSNAVALGLNASASGDCSTASGYYTTAPAYCSFAIGVANTGLNASGGASSASTWVPTDPLFEIGNGITSWSNGNPTASGPSDAFVVYKNGNVTASGVITAQPGGDIPMFTGY